MEIVLDKASRRKTPLALALRRGERLFSDSALNMVFYRFYRFFVNLLEKIRETKT
jgi:hypothetical protein